MIDFHCHLDLYPEPGRVAEDCGARGMYVLSVTTTPAAWDGTTALGRGHSRIRTALGLHPQLAGTRKGEVDQFGALVKSARYVGEIGLDGSPGFGSFWRDQVEVFKQLLTLCRSAGGRVMSIHSRRAEDEVLSCLEGCSGAGTAVLHWFSGSQRSLRRAVEAGCWFSVGPSMFRAAKGRALVAEMPRERVLTESDGPFAVQGGRPAMPWGVQEAVAGLASMWQLSAPEAQEQLLLNLRRLVGSGPVDA